MNTLIDMKSVLFSILLCAGLCPEAPAQIFVQSSSQQLVEDAVRGGFFLLRQDYQLQDTATGKYFGRDGRNEFGSIYALGIRMKGGCCLPDRGVRPWEYDANFDHYRMTHLPVIYKTFLRELADTVIQETAAPAATKPLELASQQCYYIADTLLGRQGFEAETGSGKKQGWLVWIVADRSLEEAAAAKSVSYVIYRRDMEFRKETSEYAVDAPSQAQKLWGGAYVIPVQTAVGQLTFRVAGILLPKGEKWVMTTALEKLPTAQTVRPAGDDPVTLTPVNNDKEEKKTKKQHHDAD